MGEKSAHSSILQHAFNHTTVEEKSAFFFRLHLDDCFSVVLSVVLHHKFGTLLSFTHLKLDYILHLALLDRALSEDTTTLCIFKKFYMVDAEAAAAW